ncbi:hypothetical protein PCASD_17239 [Puccinia coronata f. sp. avenae]|uniref:Uncharacterized protein n=1 Tax=Puccinia coronata f. sp. avenae TaxID=200324 RepID=A0A2N5T9T7_9BASI|nr:hypothetical protein PCASD_17239 [Puccinia coronata f. sp. avenae]
MEALVAKIIFPESSQLASQLGPAASDDENSICKDYRDLDVYLDEIYKTAVGKRVDEETPGISIESPPSHFKYNTHKTPAPVSNGPSLGAGSLDTLQMVAIATAVAQAQAVVNSTNLCTKVPAEAHVNSLTSSKPNPGAIGTISSYLNFAGVVENKDNILRMLSSYGIDHYSLFKPGHFPKEELLLIGLKIGTIAKLQANVNK